MRIFFTQKYFCIVFLFIGSFLTSFSCFSQSITFNYTGSVQTWIVPPCVNTITVTAAGAKGGGTTGGNGALVTGTFSVTQGQTLYIYVGGNGICGSNSGGGWNGGGTGKTANSAANGSCGGGGATDLRISGTTLNDRVIVAAGGGGMGGGTQDATGGFGGCAAGGTGVNSFGGGGTGGTQFSGGNGGTPWGSGLSGSAGFLAQGADGATDNCYNNSPGGGGGGGYYGGGSGGADCYASAPYGGGGGGGGSSLVPAGGSCNQGINSQPNGYLTITYTVGTGVASASNTGPYCEGSTIQLNGSIADSYSWTGPNGFSSNLQTPSIPSSSIVNGGVYSLTTTSLGCTSTGTTTVTINPLPAVNAGPDQSVCENTSVTLSASGASIYSWNNGVSDGIPFVPVVGTTTYTVAGISPQGCLNTDNVSITVSALTIPTFAQINPICNGGTITLPTTSNNSILGSWSPAINNTSTTAYTFTPDAGQCANTASMTVSVTQPVTPTFTQINPICSGDALTLPSSSNNSFIGTWSPAINNVATTNYTFTPDAGQCASTAAMTVTVNQPVVPLFTQINPICNGGTINLPTTSTNSYTGSWSPAVNNTATTNYTFTPTAGQCATTAAMTVTVNQPVTPTFTAWGPYCQDAILVQVMLPTTSSEGINGSWNPGMVSTATPGNNVYTFTPNSSECANVTTMTVVVNPNITPSFSAISPICSGDPITLITNSIENITGTWTPPINNTQTTTYTFTPTAGQCANTNTLTVNVGAPVTPTFTAIPSQCAGSTITLSNSSLEGFTGTWSPAVNNQATTNYTFTPTAGQCATTASMTVSIDAPVQTTFTAIGPFCSGSTFTLPVTSNEGYTGSWSPAINNQTTTDYTFNLDPGQCALNGLITVTISSNPTIDITNAILTNESCNQMDGSISGIVINNGTQNFTYQWNNNASLNTLDLQGLTAGTYDLEVTDQLGCTATASVVIDENQAPTIDASGVTVAQPTCLQGGQINGLLVNGNGPFDYQWTNTAQTTLSINNLTDGNYSLQVTDVNGCTVNYGPVAIVTPAGPTADFTWSPNEPYIGDNVTFTNNSNAVTNFNSEWTIGSLTFNATNLDHSFEDNGTYTVQLIVTDMNDCVDTIVQTIYVIGDVTIPNILTLNDDGANEVFLIDGLKENSSLVIINRWGNVVFETTNYLNDWKGINKQSGDRVLDGVYTYLLTEHDGSKKYGFIHVVH
jgi:hypothetical protein